MLRSALVFILVCGLFLPLFSARPALAQGETDSAVLVFDQYFDGSQNGGVLATMPNGGNDQSSVIYKIQCTGQPVHAFINAPGRTDSIDCGILSPAQTLYVVEGFYLTMDNVTAGAAHVQIWRMDLGPGCTSRRLDYGQTTTITLSSGDSRLFTSVEGLIDLTGDSLQGDYTGHIPKRYTNAAALPLGALSGTVSYTFANTTSYFSGRVDKLIICPAPAVPTSVPTNTPTRTATSTPTRTATSVPTSTPRIITATPTSSPTRTATSIPTSPPNIITATPTNKPPTSTPRPPTATTIPPTPTPTPPTGCNTFSGTSNGQGVLVSVPAGYTGYMLLSKNYIWVDLEYLAGNGQWTDATAGVQVNAPASLPTNLGALRFWSHDAFTVRLCAGSIPAAPTATTFPSLPTSTPRPATAVPQATATIKPVNTVNVPTPVPADNVQCTDKNIYGGEVPPQSTLPDSGTFAGADYIQIMYRTRDYMTLQVRTSSGGAAKGDYAVNQGFQPFFQWGASRIYVKLIGVDSTSSSNYMTLRICKFIDLPTYTPTSTPTKTPTATPNYAATATAEMRTATAAAYAATIGPQTATALAAQQEANQATQIAIANNLTATSVARESGYYDDMSKTATAYSINSTATAQTQAASGCFAPTWQLHDTDTHTSGPHYWAQVLRDGPQFSLAGSTITNDNYFNTFYWWGTGWHTESAYSIPWPNADQIQFQARFMANIHICPPPGGFPLSVYGQATAQANIQNATATAQAAQDEHDAQGNGTCDTLTGAGNEGARKALYFTTNSGTKDYTGWLAKPIGATNITYASNLHTWEGFPARGYIELTDYSYGIGSDTDFVVRVCAPVGWDGGGGGGWENPTATSTPVVTVPEGCFLTESGFVPDDAGYYTITIDRTGRDVDLDGWINSSNDTFEAYNTSTDQWEAHDQNSRLPMIASIDLYPYRSQSQFSIVTCPPEGQEQPTATPTVSGDPDLPPDEPTATPTATPQIDGGATPTPIYAIGENTFLPPCVGVLPTPDPAIAAPDLAFVLPTWEPFAEPSERKPVDTGDTVKNVRLMVTDAALPVQTLVAWSSMYVDGGGWQASNTAAAPIAEKVSDTFGWLYFFKMLGPLTYLLIPVLLVLLVKIVRATLSIVKYAKQILPFQ